MRVFRIAVLIFLFFFSCEKNDFSDSTFLFLNNVSTGSVFSVNTFGGSNNDVATSTVATSDGGYMVVGYTHSNDGDLEGKPDTSFDVWVLKFNSQNAIEWKKTYGGSNDDRARKIIQTSDGNFIIIGYSDSSDGNVTSNNGQRDFWILKIDPLGNILWEKSYGFAGNDEGFDIKETPEGNLVAVGIIDITASGGQGNIGRLQTNHAGGDYWVLKLNSSGDLIWARFFGGSFTDTAFNLSFDVSNNIYIAGSSDSDDVDITNNKGGYDFWVIKINENGTLVWEKSFGGSQIDQGTSIVNVGNNFLVAGVTLSSDVDIQSNKGGADAWFTLINADGSLLNSFNLGGAGFDFANSLSPSIDGNWILTGNSRSSDGDVSNNNGQNDVWVAKIDANGSVIWKASIGGNNIDLGNSAAQLKDGSIVVVGESSSSSGDILENKGFADALIITIK